MLVRKTALGLFIEAVGGNASASRYAGVNATAVKWMVYVFSGACACVAGLITAGDINAADPEHNGQYLELDAILAVVIGGTSLAGGRFSLGGTLVGAFIIQTMTTMILTLGIAPEITLVYKAAIVAVVCLIQSQEARALVRRLVFQRPDKVTSDPPAAVDREDEIVVAAVDATELVSVASDVTGEP